MSQVLVVHAFNPSTWEAEAGRFLSSRPLVYRVSSRIARATQRSPVSKEPKKKKKKDFFSSKHHKYRILCHLSSTCFQTHSLTVYVHDCALYSYCPIRYHYRKKWISNNTLTCILTHIFHLDIGQCHGHRDEWFSRI
jgi:hypothetical protein